MTKSKRGTSSPVTATLAVAGAPPDDEPDVETVDRELPESSAALRDRLGVLAGQIADLEATIAGQIDQLADPTKSADAERELAKAEALLRVRRGTRAGLVDELAAAEARERAEAQRPQRARLHTVAHGELPEAAAAFRAALESVLTTGRALAAVLHEIGTTAEAAGHRRSSELQHPTPNALAGGATGRLALPLTVFGIGYRLAPAHHAGDRLMGLDALPRLVGDVQAIVANEGVADA